MRMNIERLVGPVLIVWIAVLSGFVFTSLDNEVDRVGTVYDQEESPRSYEVP